MLKCLFVELLVRWRELHTMHANCVHNAKFLYAGLHGRWFLALHCPAYFCNVVVSNNTYWR